jgi:uncharacterized ferritin-like protein (DUF455 family)
MENNQIPEELNIEYKFVDISWKQEYILARMADNERTHFELMVDRLDPTHSEYEDWFTACQNIVQEIDRLKYIYRQLGGSFGAEFVNSIPVELDG